MVVRRNVLVFPGGTEIGLEIRAALCERKEVELFSAAAPGSNHAPFAYRTHDIVPPIDEPGWFEALCDVIAKREIDYVFAAHEDVLLELARRRDQLPATLIASPTATIEIARSKRLTYAALEGVVRLPRVVDTSDPSAVAYPVFGKPDRGAGSREARVVTCAADLERMLSADEEFIVTEFAPGEEYTIDCLSDRERGLMFCGPRRRDRIRSGISMDSTTFADPDLTEMAEKIDGALDLHGAWFFQARRSETGEWVLLEVGARIGGTMAASRALGANLPWLSILEAERAAFDVLLGDYRVQIDRALVNRYDLGIPYDVVYVDLDDTLIVNGHVNTLLVRFLYQALNEGKRVVVITRHAEDPYATLERYRLSSLPHRVVHLDRDVSKADSIPESSAILIDDSFGERLDVFRRRGIPVFDGNMVEALINDRA